MTTRRTFILAGASLPLVLAACGGKEASGSEPPSIKLGRDVCDRCGMVISEERFASGIVDKEGNAQIFDDPGEMVAVAQEEGLDGRQAWIHGYPSLKWMNAKDAIYVVSRDIPTPMGTGVFPFDNEAEATNFATERKGVVYAWEELLTSWPPKSMMNMD